MNMSSRLALVIAVSALLCTLAALGLVAGHVIPLQPPTVPVSTAVAALAIPGAVPL